MSRHHILAVDDDPVILEIYARAFDDTPYDVSVAADGPAALALARQDQPDIVLLDVQLPGLRGSELLPLIKQSCPDTSVIVVSGQTSVAEARRFLANGAFDFLPKPFSLKHLLDVVENWRLSREFGC